MRRRHLPAFALTLIACTLALAQTTQPTTAPATQPARQGPDRGHPIGMCVLFDQTIADLGVEKGFDFYHVTTAQQRRLARSELEFYVAVNRLVRLVKQKHGADAAREVREALGDSDDYSDVTLVEDGDAAAIQRPGQTPFPLIKIDGHWRFSMPDFLDILGEDADLLAMRAHYEGVADVADEIRGRVESGQLNTPKRILQAVESAMEGQE
jgi:hypothetical protein